MTDYQEWLAALKPGDSWHCVISIDFSGMRVARAEVIRLTNTQIVCGLDGVERRFRKDDGRAIGGWSLHKLPQPATVEELRNARAAQLPRLLASVTRSEALSWPDETVEQIAQLILTARRRAARRISGGQIMSAVTFTTQQQRAVIDALLEVARAAHRMVDDADVDVIATATVPGDLDALCAALDRLGEVATDAPDGYAPHPTENAAHMLRGQWTRD